MKSQLNKIALIAGLAAMPALNALSQPYYVVGDVINGWADPGAILMTSNSPTLWSYVVSGGTPGNYEELKVTAGSWGTAWPNNNFKVRIDAGGTNTIYFRPGSPGDGWLPLANRVGCEDPGNMTWDIAGDFNSWNGGAGYELNSIGNGVYSNTIVIATAGTYGFKFREGGGSWNVAFGSPDMGHNNANASITTTNSPQSVPMVLDLPNGRFLIGDLVPPPVTNEVVFLVDMSVEILRGTFDPAIHRVNVSGAFNGWPGTATNALILTNVPTWGGNTNIYYATNTFIGTPSLVASEYKFTDDVSGYEPISLNRSFSLLPTNGTLVLPVVFFGDALLSDYLDADTTVTFSLNMAGRMSVSNVVFDPSVHQPPYINGNFFAGGWTAWNPIDLHQMTEDPAGSTNYTLSWLVPKGGSVRVQYKYAFDDLVTPVGNLDNEAPSGQDHVRFIRTTATGTYTNAQDTFGIQYGEPSFGQLSVGPASGGTVPVQWLGRPGVRLQSTADVTGAWTQYNETDGTNWSAGVSSTNGLVSVTNWPAVSGNQFFRLIRE